MANPARILSLFSGHAGLDLGVKIAMPESRVLAYVEREAFAAASLMARMEESALERAPVFCGDICELDGREFRGHVDWIVGGFPCQDISTAGKRAGIKVGTRSGLWFEFARIIEEAEPSGVFIENVSALLSGGLDVVLRELAALGFDAEWGVFSAAGVGAPHKRERVFIMAHRAGRGLGKRGQSPGRDGFADGGDGEVDNPASPRRDAAGQRASADSGSGERLSGEGRDTMADTGHSRGSRAGIEPRPEQAVNATGPDGIEVADTGCAGDERRDDAGSVGGVQSAREGQGPQRKRTRRNVGGAGVELAYPADDHRRQGEQGEPRRGRDRLADDGAGLADAIIAERGRQDAGRQTQRRVSPGGPSAERGRDLGDAARERPEGRGSGGGSGNERLLEQASTALPPFPPGPGDRVAWAAIIADGQGIGLSPAVEPRLCVLVDGLALVVDESRADQLRGCGNGVVPLAAAVAFVVLARRLGLDG